jgi:hypothetical protein
MVISGTQVNRNNSYSAAGEHCRRRKKIHITDAKIHRTKKRKEIYALPRLGHHQLPLQRS